MIDMIDRSKVELNLKHYVNANPLPVVLEEWASPTLVPLDRQYILRMPLRLGNSVLLVPDDLKWIASKVHDADEHQKAYFGNRKNNCYITIRHGIANSTTDDEWHVDGFSVRIPHAPERNYVWSDRFPTEFLLKNYRFPEDFDPLKHDVNEYIKCNSGGGYIWRPEPRQWVLIDPYCVHRRQSVSSGVLRTFVRITFTDIEIKDGRNQFNPLLRGRIATHPPNDFKKTLKQYVPKP